MKVLFEVSSGRFEVRDYWRRHEVKRTSNLDPATSKAREYVVKFRFLLKKMQILAFFKGFVEVRGEG